jgi:hypothetical protein
MRSYLTKPRRPEGCLSGNVCLSRHFGELAASSSQCLELRINLRQTVSNCSTFRGIHSRKSASYNKARLVDVLLPVLPFLVSLLDYVSTDADARYGLTGGGDGVNGIQED